MMLHKDGKHVDATISFNKKLISSTNIPISRIKLHRGDPNITMDLKGIDVAKNSADKNSLTTFKFADIR